MTDDPRPRDEAALVDLIRSIDVGAPRHLHDSIEAMAAGRQRSASRPGAFGGLRLRLGAAATGLAAVAAALALALSGSGGGLSLGQASSATLRPATLGAPRENPGDHGQLTAAVDGISFPYWGDRFGWRATGSRVDRIGGHTLKTVLYSNGKGRTVGYTIVAGTPAPPVGGSGEVTWRSGTAYHLARVGGVNVVTWTRDGHLCIVAGRGVEGAKLLTLASWDDQPRAT